MILLADSKVPDQTAQMCRLIWAYAASIRPKTHFRKTQPIWAITWQNVPLTCGQLSLKSDCIFVQSDQIFCCLHEETLHKWLSKMHPVKILTRLHKCTDWNPCWAQMSKDTFSHAAAYLLWVQYSYHMYSDRQAWANSIDSDEMQNAVSHQVLCCLPLIQQFSDIG